MAAGLDRDPAHSIVQEGEQQTQTVAASARASQDDLRQRSGLLQHLGPGLLADDRLEAAHQGREGMGPQRGTQDVVGPVAAPSPGAQGLVHGLLEGSLPRLHGHDFGAEEPHARHIRRLPGHVGDAHVHRAGQTQPGAGGGGGHAVLARAGLGDDLRLAHAPGEDRLGQGIVDLVGAGVGEVFPLQEESLQAQLRGQARRG